jgi:hypothetical protein
MCATAAHGRFQCGLARFQCGPLAPAKFPEGKTTGFFSGSTREKSGISGEKFGFVIDPAVHPVQKAALPRE